MYKETVVGEGMALFKRNVCATTGETTKGRELQVEKIVQAF